MSVNNPTAHSEEFRHERPRCRLVSIKEAAELLGCSEANVYALREAGELPFVSIGVRKGYRFDLRDIEAFIERRKESRAAARPKVPRPRLKHIRLT